MASRKLWYSIGTSIAIIAFAVFCGFVPAAGSVFPEVVTGLIGTLALYIGGNVANKHVLGKILAPPEEDEPEPPAPAPAA